MYFVVLYFANDLQSTGFTIPSCKYIWQRPHVNGCVRVYIAQCTWKECTYKWIVYEMCWFFSSYLILICATLNEKVTQISLVTPGVFGALISLFTFMSFAHSFDGTSIHYSSLQPPLHSCWIAVDGSVCVFFNCLFHFLQLPMFPGLFSYFSYFISSFSRPCLFNSSLKMYIFVRAFSVSFHCLPSSFVGIHSGLLLMNNDNVLLIKHTYCKWKFFRVQTKTKQQK